MDWSNEDYVRMYTRETSDDLMLSWEAIALWRAMLCKFDRSGLIATRRGSRALAALVRMPHDVVESALAELVDDGRIQAKEVGYFAPNFLAAQTATKSDRQRQKEARDRRAAETHGLPNVGQSNNPVTPRDGAVTFRDETSRAVTRGHEPSQPVTLTSADPCLARSDASLPAGARAIPPQGTDPSTREPSLDQLWSELEAERQRVAVKLGIPLLPLVAHDEGRDLLARMLVDATSKGKRAELAAQVRNAIAVAGSEAEADPKELQWFSGAIFSARNFRRLAAAPPPKAKRMPPAAAPPLPAQPVASPTDRSAWLAEDTASIAPQLLAAKEPA